MEDSERLMSPQELGPFGPLPSDGTGRTLPVEAMTRFTAAEGRLYPMAMTDPEGYQLAITLVGLVADDLREQCDSFDAVLAARATLVERVPQIAAEAGVAPAVPAETVVDAASALRCRELQATS